MSDRIRTGLLGIDHAHARDLLQVLKDSEDYEVVGVWEPDAAFREQYGSEPELKNVPWVEKEALLEDDTVQMLAIECGIERALDFAEMAVDAGKHIHLDKSAGTNLGHFKTILDKTAQKDLLLQMGYMFRYNPGFDLIRHCVDEGWLGEVFSIHASMCTDLGQDKRDRYESHPGGVMLELGCHLIDMIVLILGAPAKVTPYLRHDANANDAFLDNTLAVLEYPHALVSVEITAMEPEAFGARRFKIAGDEGSVILSPLEPPVARVALDHETGEFAKGSTTVKLPDLARHIRDVADFAACIRGEKTFHYTREHDYKVQKTVMQACGVNV